MIWQVQSSTLLLSESLSAAKRLPFLRVELHSYLTQLRLKPDRLAGGISVADMTALDLCSHGHGIAEVLLQRTAEPGAINLHERVHGCNCLGCNEIFAM